MFRLTREVRFAVGGVEGAAFNSYAGYPSLTGFGTFLALQVTLSGPLDPASGYLVNIKQIDAAVRQRAIPAIARAITARAATPAPVVRQLHDLLDAWPPLTLEQLTLKLSPFLAFSTRASERHMIRLSQKFEFSATHRLHNPELSEEDNRRVFGKCNNPHGHGHNYEVQVTLRGEPDENGVVIEVPDFEQIVASTVIQRFDHRHLNVELPEFQKTIPTVENIAATIYRLLKPKFNARASLAAVTVWETPKTWCEYSE